MLTKHNRALKEWAIACEAMKEGRQTILIRKGGIREEDGEFHVSDKEFFLMPTYEHQDAALLQPEYVPQLRSIQSSSHDPYRVTIDTYATVDTVLTCADDHRLRSLDSEHIWNDRYIQMRLNFNPYDPLYILILRVYRLPTDIDIPLLAQYEGCKSWVTLEKAIPLMELEPAIADEDFALRRARVLDALGSN